MVKRVRRHIADFCLILHFLFAIFEFYIVFFDVFLFFLSAFSYSTFFLSAFPVNPLPMISHVSNYSTFFFFEICHYRNIEFSRFCIFEINFSGLFFSIFLHHNLSLWFKCKFGSDEFYYTLSTQDSNKYIEIMCV
jgi:hypothetical protein